MARKPHPDRGPRPKQGQRLLDFRETASLSQVELAKAIGVANANMAHWEWSENPPRAEMLPKLAKVLGVRIEDLLGSSAALPDLKKQRPVGEVQKAFEEVRKLPRKQQRKIVETVYALVHEYKRKAS